MRIQNTTLILSVSLKYMRIYKDRMTNVPVQFFC